MGAKIISIEPDSPLRAKVYPGDELVAINGNKIKDVLDYKYLSYDGELTLQLADGGGRMKLVRAKKAEGADLGLTFENYLMDRPRACKNRCVFCFVDQLPKNMRPTLYFKDDDVRLSLLTGNYVTLTNLTERELQRVIDLRVSPINVSVHATQPELRARLLGNPEGGNGFELMKKLALAGINMNCQIVCCPGINDGEALQRSMEDLAALRPGVRSVSVVPVGLTRHRESLFELRPFDAASAAQVVDMVEAFADGCAERPGSRVFFCADELYIKAGRELPADEYYEDYPQLENGVGMLRLFETQFMEEMRAARQRLGARAPFSIATGVSAAPMLEKLLLTASKKCGIMRKNVYPVVNDFFGHGVNVSGLVTGGDLIRQLKGRALGDRLLLPANMLRDREGAFLDDVTVGEVSRELGVPVRVVAQDGAEFYRAIERNE